MEAFLNRKYRVLPQGQNKEHGTFRALKTTNMFFLSNTVLHGTVSEKEKPCWTFKSSCTGTK